MLQHRFDDEAILTAPSKKKGDKKLNEKEKIEVAKQFLYLNKQGKVCQPSSHIEGAMIKAGTQFKFVGKKTYKDMMKAACFVFPEYIPHKNQKWEVDSRAVVNPTTRGRKMCYRPRIEDWSLDFTLEVNDDRIDSDVVKQILETAGMQIGIGAYRPRFGRFEVTSFKVV